MNRFANCNVFVSGGAGVIGRALVQKLQGAGARIFVGDLKPRPKEFSQEILFRQGDLNRISKEELQHFKPRYFFHLAAAFERSLESYDFWEENYRNNILLSHHLIDCLKESQTLKRVIFASSYLIYDPESYFFDGPQKNPCPLSEKSPIKPRNLCGMAKLLHEGELRFLTQFDNAGFTYAAARIFRSYGRGSLDVISRWVRALLKGEEITVYSKEGLFDYIFADDVAEGLLRLGALDRSVVVNLGRGRSRTVVEVLEALKRHFPKMKAREVSADIPLEASQADMELFKTLTGWQPSLDLEEAIPLIIDFERSNL